MATLAQAVARAFLNERAFHRDLDRGVSERAPRGGYNCSAADAIHVGASPDRTAARACLRCAIPRVRDYDTKISPVLKSSQVLGVCLASETNEA